MPRSEFHASFDISVNLTQIVYIPNTDSNNDTSSNGELVCPIRYDTRDETPKSVGEIYSNL